MSAEILLVRHGRVANNDIKDVIHGRSSGEPLIELGIVQAEAQGNGSENGGREIVAVLSSTAVRAVMTAQAALQAADVYIRPHYDSRLEEVHQGDWVGRNRHDVHTPEIVDERNQLGFDFAAPGGQSGNHKIAEVLETFREHVPIEGTSVVYTHGLTERLLIAHARKWSPDQIGDLEIANASTTSLEWNGSDLRVNYINDVSYLNGIVTL